MKKAIIGAGGFGREVRAQILDNNKREDITFFVDDIYAKNDILPLGSFDPNEYEAIVAIGDPISRKNIIDRLPKKTKFFTFIHKSVMLLDNNIDIGEGSIICAGCILTTNIKLGKHSHLNLNTTVGHDCIIDEYFTTAPNVNISGNCTIGKNVYMGTGVSIKQQINICDNTVFGMNCAVIRNIIESGTYIGIPARRI